ncbi:DUF6338 family protein [Amycolatopsis jejuensis]|uniref:DUF6338 family protein n=1 Tax=Amycolatopsis jejuensis TaxID=330084 RepID=UPI0005246642|nr:DUF6338 family protein [Amycolatopsis jejuensis]
MPTTAVSLAALIVLAFPGYVLHRRLRRRRPEQVRSTLDELLTIVFSGAAIDVVVTVVFVLGAAGFGIPLPRFDSIVAAPSAYVAQNVLALTLWSAAFLVAAIGLAFVVGSPRWPGLGDKVAPEARARRRRGEPQQSAWWLLFHENPGSRIYLGCLLTDGGYLAGYLHSYSTLVAETGDRELTLEGDVEYRPPGGATAVLPQVNAVSVKAEHIQVLTVTYVVPEPPEETVPDAP